MKSLFISLLLALPTTAFAVYPLQVMPKAECVAALETVLNPETTVENGLTALENANKETVSMDSCFESMFSNWQGTFPVKQISPPIAASKYQQLYNEYNQKLVCFNQYADQGYGQQYVDQYKQQYDSVCSGKWLTKDEYVALIEKKKRVESSYYLFAAVANAFRETFEDDRKKIDQENMKLSYCKPNPYPEGTYNYDYFKNSYHAKCPGTVLTQEEFIVQAGLVNQLQQDLNQKVSVNNTYVQKIAQIFGTGSPPDIIMDQFETLQPLAQALVCTNPYSDTVSTYYQNWKWNTGNNCQGKNGDPDGIASARKKFLDAIGDLDLMKAKVDKDRLEAQAKMKALQQAADRVKYLSYNYRRLYAFFRKHLKDGGGTDDLGAFCEKYEANLEKDKKFFDGKFPGGDEIGFMDFNSNNWKPVDKYGMSEAEYSILRHYIGSFYRKLNSLLYGGDTSAEVQLYRDTLNAALDKIPAYSGDPLLRFSTLPDTVLDKHQVGEIITYDSFTSTSKNKNWNWNGNSRFLVYAGKNGKDVSTDFNPGEQEVIFKAGTRFKVVSKEKTPKSTYLILVEVDEQDAPMAAIVPPAGEMIP